MTDTAAIAATEIPSLDPRTGALNGSVLASTDVEVDAAVSAAADVAEAVFGEAPADRSRWLLAVSAALMADQEAIIEIGCRETGLSRERLAMELGGAARQWEFYAAASREGSWLGATIDHATDASLDLRRVGVSVGSVAVFGASNFPLGFGMLGHDTASALAAGSPVVAKAHPAHPLLSERLASVARDALRSSGAPEGAFQVVAGFEAGRRLVLDPRIGAVAFTGSQAGGMALVELSRTRDVPIPVFAEMGTVNPVVVTPAAASGGVGTLAEGFVRSIRFGSGQVCTKPGLVFVPRGSGFGDAVDAALRDGGPAGWALTAGIAEAYRVGVQRFLDAGASRVSGVAGHADGWAFDGAVLGVELDDLQQGSPFLAECFGPVGLIAEYDDPAEVVAAVRRMQGALAASVFGGDESDPHLPALVHALASKVGRVVVGRWPSGVATTWAQHHGGPWPATSDPTATSVGAAALSRFVRPVAFEGMPDAVLPPALREANPWSIPRRIDGSMTTN